MVNDEPVDWEAELERLKKELVAVRKEIKKESNRIKKSFSQAKKKVHKAIDLEIDFGESLDTYLESIIESVANSLDTALGGVFISGSRSPSEYKRKKRVPGQLIDEEHLEQFFQETPGIMSLLSDSYRLRLLKMLERGPSRQEDLTGGNLQPGTFKHHVVKLIGEGWVVHEKSRGLYMLTLSGKEALKFTEVLYFLSNPELFQKNADDQVNDDVDYEIIEN
ncbi:MAG: hypothetical protein ACTSRU_02470 [Candidatus Hodarchaeales archaeon]